MWHMHCWHHLGSTLRWCQMACSRSHQRRHSAMDIAQQKLDAAVARRVKIAELLIPARAAVEADKEATKGIRGAPTLPRKNKTAALKAAVARLENDLLPGEHREVQARPAGFLAASARENAQHHADAETGAAWSSALRGCCTRSPRRRSRRSRRWRRN